MFSAKSLQGKTVYSISSDCEIWAHRQTRFYLLTLLRLGILKLLPRTVLEVMKFSIWYRSWGWLGITVSQQKKIVFSSSSWWPNTQQIRVLIKYTHWNGQKNSCQKEPGYCWMLPGLTNHSADFLTILTGLKYAAGSSRPVGALQWLAPATLCPILMCSLHLALLFSPHSITFRGSCFNSSRRERPFGEELL